jgi:AcrR family transcriptional regulator
MALLAESCVDSVRVERLAGRMGISKVSFYWHFKDRPDFLNAMLATWQQQTALNMPAGARPPAHDRIKDRLRRLFDLPTLGDQSAFGAHVELAIRHWAKSDALARAAVEDIDTRRIAYIGHLTADTPPMDRPSRASLIYAALLALACSPPAITEELRMAYESLLIAPV